MSENMCLEYILWRARYCATSTCIVESVKVWSVCVRKKEGYVEYDFATVF
jgi:hypothetical protein